jgi:uncharacterized membrane-anchored protein
MITKPDKFTGVRLMMLAIALFLVAIVVVEHYDKALKNTDLGWLAGLFSLIAAAVFFGFMIYQLNSGKNTYDAVDLVTDPLTGKADLWKHMVIVFAALAVWTIVQQALAKVDVTNMLLGVLGIFVGKEAFRGFSDAINRQPQTQVMVKDSVTVENN